MTRVVFFDAFREQTLAPALPPARKGRPAAFGFHARTKTVLTFACSLGRLIGPFHKPTKSVGLRAVTLEVSTALSIERVRSPRDGFIRWLPPPPIFEISGVNK